MERKYCKTCFKIMGKFNVQELVDIIQVKPCNIIENEGQSELHFGYKETYDNIDEWNISDILYETIKELVDKDELLAELKEKYNLKYDLEIDTNAIDLTRVLILDGKVTTFLHWSNTRQDLKYYYF